MQPAIYQNGGVGAGGVRNGSIGQNMQQGEMSIKDSVPKEQQITRLALIHHGGS